MYLYLALVGFVTVILIGIILTCLDILRRKPANSHTLITLLKQYQIECRQNAQISKHFKLEVKRLAEDCSKTQSELLMKILKRQADTLYGRKYNFSVITDKHDFVKELPLTTYSDCAEYMNKIANGEENVLTVDKVLFIILSSGTTGKSKMFPFTNIDSDSILKCVCSEHHVHKRIAKAIGLKRMFNFRLFHSAKLSPCGLKMGGGASILFKHTIYDIVPEALKYIFKTDAAFYVQGLFLLAEPEVGVIECVTSDLLLTLFKYLDSNWPALCTDIEKGRVRPHDDITEETRIEFAKAIQPNPKRANQLRHIFQFSSIGKAKQLWPSLEVIVMVKSGSLAHSAQILKETYIKGLYCVNTFHVASEGFFGFMLEDDPELDIYTFMPHVNFLEFIPVESIGSEDPPCFFLEQVCA